MTKPTLSEKDRALRQMAARFRLTDPRQRTPELTELVEWATRQGQLAGHGHIDERERFYLRDLVARINLATAPRHHELVAIALLNGPLSTSAIAKMLHIQRESVRTVTTKLRKAGMVAMQPGTGTSKIEGVWELTPAGLARAADEEDPDCAADEAVS